MLTINLKECVETLENAVCDYDENITLNGLSTDTRKIQKGNLYIPLVGEKFDGHDFIDQAIEKGAAAVVSQKRDLPKLSVPVIFVEDTEKALYAMAHYYRNALGATVVAMTGSNGKTTTKDFTASIIGQKHRVHKTQANLNNAIGLSHTILEAPDDTEVLVLEMGMEGFGEIEILTNIASPNFAAITNIADTHLDELKTKENIARAKFEILEGLQKYGTFFYNHDDPTLVKVIQEYQIPQKVVSYGLKEDADIVIVKEGTDETGTKFSVDDHVYFIPYHGIHQVYNAALSILFGTAVGLTPEECQKGLLETEITKMRGQVLEANGFVILDDSYKSNPQSVASLVDTVTEMKGFAQKVLILGDMLALSDQDEKLHREVGQMIDANEIDFVVTHGPLSRFTHEELLKNFSADRVFYTENREEIAPWIQKNVVKDSIIAVKASRGLHFETIIEDLKTIEIR